LARAQREEEEKQRLDSQADLQADLRKLEVGVTMWKLPHHGDAKQTKFYLTKQGDMYVVSYDSKKKSEEDSCFPLASLQLERGQTTALFKEKKFQKQFGNQASLSFSLLSPKRTLDVVAFADEDYQSWIRAFSALKKQMQK